MSKPEEEYDGSFSYKMEGDNYIRVCVVGNVDSGKSTLVGVLTKGLLDNGRGSSREKVFNFAHEAETGRTSSIAQEIMVFDSNQQQIFAERFVQKKNKYWTEIVPQAKKIVNLIDLCGHEKYLKTTIVGMVGMIPEYTLIVIGANAGLTKMTKEHLGIALALEIPFFIVITKIDMVDQETLKKTIAEIKKILKAQYVGKKAFMVQLENLVAIKPQEEGKKDENRMVVYKEQLSAEEEEMISQASWLISTNEICPIFQISSITGQGMKLLNKFMYNLKTRQQFIPSIGSKDKEMIFDIHDKFHVQGVGIVVSGLIKQGTIRVNEHYLMGPDKTGEFYQVVVKSMHFAWVPIESCQAGMFCTVQLKSSKKKHQIEEISFRKGLVLLDMNLNQEPIRSFEGMVSVLHHSSTIQVGYESVFHCGIVWQTVKIIDMQKQVLRTGDKDAIKFNLLFSPEIIWVGEKFLLREGRTKILGVVTKVYHQKDCVD